MNVLDLFSGAGGMSCGFHRHPAFHVVGAVDAQNGKPSSGEGSLECNKTYAANMGFSPLNADLGKVTPSEVARYIAQSNNKELSVDVLISCAPCTGFSRTIRKNLINDDARNSLVARSADFVRYFRPAVFLMENVGELLTGKARHHFNALREELEGLGYNVDATVHKLENFGLPQRRRRALVIAVKNELPLLTLEHLWAGVKTNPEATTVRRAIGHLKPLIAGERDPNDACHVSCLISEKNIERLEATPADGGSWPDWLDADNGWDLLIPSMRKHAEQGRVGPYRDVYGRMTWDTPANTVKRECSNLGNGRYAHPEQDRLCTVREMANIQGFPKDFVFEAKAISNMYRHVGDAVPPLISYQLASLSDWIVRFGGREEHRPPCEDIILPGTSLHPRDLTRSDLPTVQHELCP